MKAFAPKAQLQTIVDDWNGYYVERTRAAMEGTWESVDTWDGIEPGMVGFGEYNASIPDDVKAAAEIVREGIVAGTLHPFQGPVLNQAFCLMVRCSVWITTLKVLSDRYPSSSRKRRIASARR